MNAVADVALTVLAAMFAMFALSFAWSIYVPRPTRALCFIVGLPAGVYAVSRMPVGWALAAVGFMLLGLLVDGVAQRPSWNRHAARAMSRARVDGTRLGRLFLVWLGRWLVRRRGLAEALAGAALTAMASSCESCERAEGWLRVQYPDGQAFRLCFRCASLAMDNGAVRSHS